MRETICCPLPWLPVLNKFLSSGIVHFRNWSQGGRKMPELQQSKVGEEDRVSLSLFVWTILYRKFRGDLCTLRMNRGIYLYFPLWDLIWSLVKLYNILLAFSPVMSDNLSEPIPVELEVAIEPLEKKKYVSSLSSSAIKILHKMTMFSSIRNNLHLGWTKGSTEEVWLA